MDHIKLIKFIVLIKLVILSLSSIYLMQLISPLRLQNDSIVFLSLSESFINGHGFLYNGLPTHFPPGYPALLSLLDFIGLRYTWIFIATNLVFLFIGNTLLYYISCEKYGINKAYYYLIIVFTLLSWVFIKHVTLPLSDLTFYGLSMVAIGALSYAESAENKYWPLFFLIGILFTFLAVTVRTVGMAIFAALIFQAFHKKIYTDKLLTLNWIQSHIISSIVLAVAVMFIIISVININYFGEALQVYHNNGGVLRGTLLLCVDRLSELGGLIVNLPITKIPQKLSPIITLIGLAFLIVLIHSIYGRHDNLFLVDYYIVCYLLIIFFWPYKDPRFWLPIVPLLICQVAIIVQKVNISRLLTSGFCAYLIIYSLIGMAALGYSTRISLAGVRFPDFYTEDESLRNAYRIFFAKEEQAKELPVNEEALHLLRRFNDVQKGQ